MRLYVSFAVGAALLLTLWTARNYDAPVWRDVAFFWIVASVANLLGRVELPLARLRLLVEDDDVRGVPIAPGFIVLVTAAYATRPTTAIAVALIPAIPLIIAERREPLKLVFNTCQEAIYVGLASTAFWTMKELVAGVPGLFAGAALGALTAVVLNHLLVGGIVAIDRGVAIREVARRMAWPAPVSLVFGTVALLVASLYSASGPASALFLFMPLIALRVVREAKISLDTATRRTLTDFARAVDEKDPYTYRHSDRVATITVELHRELGTRARDFEKRWSAALLHDVGKVAVPARILRKATALSSSEYELMKEHPGIGADVVKEIDVLRDLAPEIRSHHERVDGRGYPDGLSGAEIPFDARVLAVADAFEALTSDRPYRRALTNEEALAELDRAAGSQHDPVVVAALRSVIGRGVTFVRPDRDLRRETEADRPRLRQVQTA